MWTFVIFCVRIHTAAAVGAATAADRAATRGCCGPPPGYKNRAVDADDTHTHSECIFRCRWSIVRSDSSPPWQLTTFCSSGSTRRHTTAKWPPALPATTRGIFHYIIIVLFHNLAGLHTPVHARIRRPRPWRRGCCRLRAFLRRGSCGGKHIHTRVIRLEAHTHTHNTHTHAYMHTHSHRMLLLTFQRPVLPRRESI
jgi:hypothetical protein